MLLGDRFEELSILAAGMSQELIAANRETFQQLGNPAVESILLQESPQLLVTSAVLTGWTLLIEGAVATAFLWPVGRAISRARDILLMTFTWATYAFVPVSGFAWTLVVLGLAQCGPERRRTRIAYLLTFALIIVYQEVP